MPTPAQALFTIVATGTDAGVANLCTQMAKLVNVRYVEDITDEVWGRGCAGGGAWVGGVAVGVGVGVGGEVGNFSGVLGQLGVQWHVRNGTLREMPSVNLCGSAGGGCKHAWAWAWLGLLPNFTPPPLAEAVGSAELARRSKLLPPP